MGRLSRRGVLGAALAAGLAAPARARAADEGDLLSALWKREMAARVAYGVHGALPQQLRIHAGRHAAALATELAAVGLGLPRPPRALGDLDTAAARLARARGAGVVPAAIALERALIELYRDTLPALQDAKVAMTAATILASHAQHELTLHGQDGLPRA